MSEDMIEETLEEHRALYKATNAVLEDWVGDGNLQFPVLLGMMAVKLNWDEKQVRKNDPLVRDYVRRHPKWHVTRGAHGGIMRKETQQKKESSKLENELNKKQIREAIEAKLAKITSDKPAEIVSEDNDSDIDSE
jgi:hypothetical protein